MTRALLSRRRRHPGWHRRLGRVQVAVLLLLVLPSGVVMSRHAFGGWPAGLSFLVLSGATAGCAIASVVHARRGRYDRHRRWMGRSCVLIGSAVALRLISGAAERVGVPSPEAAYVVAAWASWGTPAGGLRGRGAGAGPSPRPGPEVSTGHRPPVP